MSTSLDSIFPAHVRAMMCCLGSTNQPRAHCRFRPWFPTWLPKNPEGNFQKSCCPLEDYMFSCVWAFWRQKSHRSSAGSRTWMKSWLQPEGWLERWPCLAVSLVGAWSYQDAVVPWKMCAGCPSTHPRTSVSLSWLSNGAGSASAQGSFHMLWSHLLMALQTYF